MIWNGDCVHDGCEREAVDSTGLCKRHRAAITRRWSIERYTSLGWAIGAYVVLPATGFHDRSLTVRVGRGTFTLHRARGGQPWPDVPECFEPAGHVCPQHDPRHEHTWQAGRPLPYEGARVPVRCVVCGARKCDRRRCIRIRHHREDHSDWLGYNGQVAPEDSAQ